MNEAEASPSAAEDDKKFSKQEELDDEDEEASGIKVDKDNLGMLIFLFYMDFELNVSLTVCSIIV
jgi:hypothetical protein